MNKQTFFGVEKSWAAQLGTNMNKEPWTYEHKNIFAAEISQAAQVGTNMNKKPWTYEHKTFFAVEISKPGRFTSQPEINLTIFSLDVVIVNHHLGFNQKSTIDIRDKFTIWKLRNREGSYPGIMTRFFSDGAQCLKTSSEKPPLIIPGPANRTQGPGASIIDRSNL